MDWWIWLWGPGGTHCCSGEKSLSQTLPWWSWVCLGHQPPYLPSQVVLPGPRACPQLSVLPAGPDLCLGCGQTSTSHLQRSPGLCMNATSSWPSPSLWVRPLSAFVFLKVPRTGWVSYFPSDPGCPDPGSLQAQDSCLLPCPLPSWEVPHSLSLFYSPLSPTANLQSVVTFDLTLDPGRLSPRAVFEETRTRNLTRVRDLGLTQHCEPVRLLLPVRGPQSPGNRGHSEAVRGLGRERTGVFWSSLCPSMAHGMQEVLEVLDTCWWSE